MLLLSDGSDQSLNQPLDEQFFSGSCCLNCHNTVSSASCVAGTWSLLQAVSVAGLCSLAVNVLVLKQMCQNQISAKTKWETWSILWAWNKIMQHSDITPNWVKRSFQLGFCFEILGLMNPKIFYQVSLLVALWNKSSEVLSHLVHAYARDLKCRNTEDLNLS